MSSNISTAQRHRRPGALALIVSACVLAAAPGASHAQDQAPPEPGDTISTVSAPGLTPPGATPPTPAPDYQPVAPAVGAARYSPKRALWLSLAGSLAGPAISVVGAPGLGLLVALVGPNAGHWYTRDTRRAALDAGIRAGCLAVAGLGVLGLAYTWGDNDDPVTWASVVAVVGGPLVFIGSTGYSVADAPNSARRANRRLQVNVGLTPTQLIDSAGRRTTGMALAGSF